MGFWDTLLAVLTLTEKGDPTLLFITGEATRARFWAPQYKVGMDIVERVQ